MLVNGQSHPVLKYLNVEKSMPKLLDSDYLFFYSLLPPFLTCLKSEIWPL